MTEVLRHPGIQEAMFRKAFDYVKAKHGEVNFQTCLFEMYNKDLEEDYIVCVCLTCISFIEMGSEDFEKIEKGLTQKIKKSIMKQVAEHFEKTS